MQAALGQGIVVRASARAVPALAVTISRTTALAAVIAANCALMLLPPALGLLILAGAIR